MVTKTNTVYREVEVEVDLDLEDFTDEEIENEYKDRFEENALADKQALEAIFHAMRQDKEDKALQLMREYVLEKLERVI